MKKTFMRPADMFSSSDATGAQSAVRFSISPDTVPFGVDLEGNLFVSAGLDFDSLGSLFAPSYTFNVIATNLDGVLSGSASVTVAVEQLNQQTPQFPDSPYSFDVVEGNARLLSAH